MKIKQVALFDIDISRGQIDVIIKQSSRSGSVGKVIIEIDSIPNICAALLTGDDKGIILGAFLKMVGILFEGRYDVAATTLSNEASLQKVLKENNESLQQALRKTTLGGYHGD